MNLNVHKFTFTFRDQVEHIFDDVDANNDGKMSLEEFVQSWNATQAISKSVNRIEKQRN